MTWPRVEQGPSDSPENKSRWRCTPRATGFACYILYPDYSKRVGKEKEKKDRKCCVVWEKKTERNLIYDLNPSRTGTFFMITIFILTLNENEMHTSCYPQLSVTVTPHIAWSEIFPVRQKSLYSISLQGLWASEPRLGRSLHHGLLWTSSPEVVVLWLFVAQWIHCWSNVLLPDDPLK
jgi:hypothetical protein